MTQQEFTSLTGVRVDEREFDAIHIVYMASDMDKFDFCNTWCKMNKSRVRSAKEQAKREAKEQENKSRLFRAIGRADAQLPHNRWFHTKAASFFRVNELASMALAGIDTGKDVSNVVYHTRVYLGIANVELF